MDERRRGALFGLLAAASFGLSVPFAKRLLTDIAPQLLAGLLYLGAASALWAWRLARPTPVEAKLRREDLPALGAVVVSGGVAAPVLLLFGLERVSGLCGSLLLNLEAPFTMLLAVTAFREHIGRPGLAAAALIVGGAATLGLDTGELRADTAGILLLAAACGCWALDNNVTQRLTLRDPLAIVRVKTLAAGAINVALAAVLGARWPGWRVVAAAAALGAVSYGLSVVLDAHALRLLGAAREAAYFATAPFLGALMAWWLGDRLGAWDAVAMAAMALGVIVLFNEKHHHQHRHDALEHDHAHHHDPHHRHTHAPGDPPGEPHSHPHRHQELVHSHPHVPDLHHRHRHG